MKRSRLLIFFLLAACQSTGDGAPPGSLEEARLHVDHVKRDLTRQGVYTCCIAPKCDFCALSIGSCSCGYNLRQDPSKPVCPECYGGWRTEHGAVPGVDPARVEMLSGEALERMFDLRIRTRVPSR